MANKIYDTTIVYGTNFRLVEDLQSHKKGIAAEGYYIVPLEQDDIRYDEHTKKTWISRIENGKRYDYELLINGMDSYILYAPGIVPGKPQWRLAEALRPPKYFGIWAGNYFPHHANYKNIYYDQKLGKTIMVDQNDNLFSVVVRQDESNGGGRTL